MNQATAPAAWSASHSGWISSARKLGRHQSTTLIAPVQAGPSAQLSSVAALVACASATVLTTVDDYAW